jgi:hypothetical protein
MSSSSYTGACSGSRWRISSSRAFSCVPFSALTGTNAAKSRRVAASESVAASFDLSPILSTLLSARITGVPAGRSSSTGVSRSSQWWASITSTITSTSFATCPTVRFMPRFNAFWCCVW